MSDTSAIVVLLALTALVTVSSLGFLGWRMWRLDQQVASLDQDYLRLQNDLQAAHQRNVEAIESRLIGIENALLHLKDNVDWLMSWVRYWSERTPRQQ